MIECNIYLREIGIDVINDKYHKEVLKGQIDAYQSILSHYFDSICPCFISPTINSADLQRVDESDFNVYLSLVDKLISASHMINHFARSMEEVKDPNTPLVVNEAQDVMDYGLQFRKHALENIGQVILCGDDRYVQSYLKDEYERTVGSLPYCCGVSFKGDNAWLDNDWRDDGDYDFLDDDDDYDDDDDNYW